MVSFTTIISTVLALSAPFVAAAAIPEAEANLAERQSFSAIRLWDGKDFSGAWADMSVDKLGECEQLPTAVKDRVSSFKLGIYKCRFFEHDNCQGANQWFENDNSNMRAASGNFGYRGTMNDEISSANCILK